MGEKVQIDGNIMVVEEIGLRCTGMRNFYTGTFYTVPNHIFTDSFDNHVLGLSFWYHIVDINQKISTKTEINHAILERFQAEGIRFAVRNQTHVQDNGVADSAPISAPSTDDPQPTPMS